MTKEEILFWVKSVSILLNTSVLYITHINELLKLYENNPLNEIFENYNFDSLISNNIKLIEENIYYISTPIKIYYIIIVLNKELNNYLVIGPFKDKDISEDEIIELKEELKLNELFTIALKKYLSSLNILSKEKLWGLCNLFLQRFYNSKNTYPINFVGYNPMKNKLTKIKSEINDDVPLWIVEERYKQENQLVESVSKGDFSSACIAYERIISNLFSYYKFSEEINELKGATIIKVLLRKGGEIGGVHPVHLENLSSKYSLLLSSNYLLDKGIIVKMIKDFCTLVNEYSLKEYSPLIRNALNYIQFNLNSELNVSGIAKYLCITPNHLYRTFKNEVGMSVIDYINKKRIEESIKLIKSTNLQIQRIAEEVGINDISYFSKVFKKQVGKSPTQYRKEFNKK